MSWMEKHGLEAVNKDKHAARGPLDRRQLTELVDAGMTIAEIAAAVDRSKTTVRHWLRRYGLQTHNSVGRRPRELATAARGAGLQITLMRCRRHGETEFCLEGRGYYRCKRCRAESVARHRRKLKETLVTEAGGCCVLCAYDRCLAALQFHHVDPGRSV
jgi:transposase